MNPLYFFCCPCRSPTSTYLACSSSIYCEVLFKMDSTLIPAESFKPSISKPQQPKKTKQAVVALPFEANPTYVECQKSESCAGAKPDDAVLNGLLTNNEASKTIFLGH